MSDKRPITGAITCAGCGESISVTAYPMIAVEKPNGIHYTSPPGPDDKIVPSERELYWYDVDCPKCGKNNESVIGQ